MVKKLYALGALLFAALFAFPLAASAADLPSRTSAPIFAAVAPASVYDWSGFYAGIQLGRAQDGKTTAVNTTFNGDGVFGGLTGGYNLQFGNVVAGVEADASISNIKMDRTLGLTTISFEPKYFGTLRGRVGYAFDNILVFATGGAYLQQSKLNVVNSASDTAWAAGWVAGAGVEYGLTKAISVKGEYLYVKTTKQDFSIRGFPVGAEGHQQIGRFGLNVKL